MSCVLHFFRFSCPPRYLLISVLLSFFRSSDCSFFLTCVFCLLRCFCRSLFLSFVFFFPSFFVCLSLFLSFCLPFCFCSLFNSSCCYAFLWFNRDFVLSLFLVLPLFYLSLAPPTFLLSFFMYFRRSFEIYLCRSFVLYFVVSFSLFFFFLSFFTYFFLSS